MEGFGQFSRLIVGGTLVLSGVIALGIGFYDGAAAIGFLGGGAAGAAGFWFMANRARKLVSIPPNRLPYHVYRWTFMRIGFYGLVLAWAYTVDREGQHALVAAVFGLLVVRVVLLVFGIRMTRTRVGESAKERRA